MMDAIRQNRKKSRHKSVGSPNQKMPIKAVPNAPMPVQTAYAVPKGIVLRLKESAEKLKIERSKKATVGPVREKLSDSLRKVVKPISNNPAISK